MDSEGAEKDEDFDCSSCDDSESEGKNSDAGQKEFMKPIIKNKDKAPPVPEKIEFVKKQLA